MLLDINYNMRSLKLHSTSDIKIGRFKRKIPIEMKKKMNKKHFLQVKLTSFEFVWKHDMGSGHICILQSRQKIISFFCKSTLCAPV